MECSTNNGKSNRLPVDSEVSRLLITVKKEGFVPSVKFEKLLLSRFYESVLDFVKYFHEESSLLYEVYLECVIIVSEKDEQFISCIENLNDDVCNHITEIARKEEYQYNKPEMYKLTLVFANLLITRISLKRSIFMGLSFHLVLLKAIKVFHIDHILLAFDIVMVMMENQKIFNDLSHVSYLISSLALIPSLKYSKLDQQSCLVATEKILTFSIAISSSMTLNFEQSKSLAKEISNAHGFFPQCSEMLRKLQENLNDAAARRIESRMNTLAANNCQGASDNKCIFMRISQLKANSSTTSKLVTRPMSSSKLFQKGVVTLQDPETNVYRALAKAGDLDDKLAEVISGMLNSNRGGRIHIGINKSGLVLGIQITRKDRDSLRCGIDALLRRVIKPALPPDAIGVHFMPVRSFEVGGDENLCVVMLTIPSNMNTLYYLSEKQTCFLRLPKGNVQLTLREVRQRAVLLTEKRYLSFSH